MENEVRYYLKRIRTLIQQKEFVPQTIVTATQLPTGAVEVAINNSNIEAKIDYILEAYDDDMQLKTNNKIVMKNLMIV